MKQTVLDLTLAVILGLAFAVLALAYFDCLYLWKVLKMYIVVWENAIGVMQQSEMMDKKSAQAFLSSLLPEQDGRIFYIRTN